MPSAAEKGMFGRGAEFVDDVPRYLAPSFPEMLRHDAHQPYLFGDLGRWIGTYTARPSREAIELMMERPQLWHGYQWSDGNRSNTTLYEAQLAAMRPGGDSEQRHQKRGFTGSRSRSM